MEKWSNNACLGYVIAGLRRKGWPDEKIKEVVQAVYFEFDLKTVDEAKEIYTRSDY